MLTIDWLYIKLISHLGELKRNWGVSTLQFFRASSSNPTCRDCRHFPNSPLIQVISGIFSLMPLIICNYQNIKEVSAVFGWLMALSLKCWQFFWEYWKLSPILLIRDTSAKVTTVFCGSIWIMSVMLLNNIIIVKLLLFRLVSLVG
jgi:hypothetical protein